MKGMRPLVAAQLALSFAVVFAAILLGRTQSYFARLDPGFNPDRLVAGQSIRIRADTRATKYRSWSIGSLRRSTQCQGVVSTSVNTCGLMTNCSYSSGFTFAGARSRHPGEQ
jgi:hypothetical protein